MIKIQLAAVMGAWQAHYSRAAYIDMSVGDGRTVETQTQEEAARRGWTFDRLLGDMVLVRRLLQGDWAEDFLVLEPGQRMVMSYDHGIIACVVD